MQTTMYTSSILDVLPQEQTDMHQVPGVDAHGTMPFFIDLSNEVDDDEGDLYELYVTVENS